MEFCKLDSCISAHGESVHIAESKLRADAKHGAKRGVGQEATPVPIDTILDAGVAGLIDTRELVERDRGSVRQERMTARDMLTSWR
jgi:hypothetical protein